MTKNYLELIAKYVSLFIILSKIDDRKTVLGLFNIAYEMTNGHGDSSFPRLGQMIIDYENPLKKITDDFVPHSRVTKKRSRVDEIINFIWIVLFDCQVVYESLQSLSQIYKFRNAPVDELKRNSILNFTTQANYYKQMTMPPIKETVCYQLEKKQRYAILTIFERILVFLFF